MAANDRDAMRPLRRGVERGRPAVDARSLGGTGVERAGGTVHLATRVTDGLPALVANRRREEIGTLAQERRGLRERRRPRVGGHRRHRGRGPRCSHEGTLEFGGTRDGDAGDDSAVEGRCHIADAGPVGRTAADAQGKRGVIHGHRHEG